MASHDHVDITFTDDGRELVLSDCRVVLSEQADPPGGEVALNAALVPGEIRFSMTFTQLSSEGFGEILAAHPIEWSSWGEQPVMRRRRLKCQNLDPWRWFELLMRTPIEDWPHTGMPTGDEGWWSMRAPWVGRIWWRRVYDHGCDGLRVR